MKKNSLLDRTAAVYEKIADTVNIIFNMVILCSRGAQVILRAVFDLPLKLPQHRHAKDKGGKNSIQLAPRLDYFLHPYLGNLDSGGCRPDDLQNKDNRPGGARR